MLGALIVSLLFLNPTLNGFQARDSNGDPQPLAELTFWRAGTTALQAVYEDQELSVELSNPVVADDTGQFPRIYLTGDNYRVRLEAANGVLAWDVDPYICDCDEGPYVFRPPVYQSFGEDVQPGALLTFTITETDVPTDTYADVLKKVPHPNPLKADAGGYFPPVYMNDATDYRIRLTWNGEELRDIDPYICACGYLLLTSRPYALEVIESMDIAGDLQRGSFQPVIIESMNIGALSLDGTLVAKVLTYSNYAPEALDVAGLALNSTLVSKVLTYGNYEPEEIDISAEALNSTLVSKVVTYGNYEPEEIGISATQSNGTLVQNDDPFFANVSLLCAFDGADASTTITDDSLNGFTLTASGNAQLDTAQKKFGSASLLQDGTSDWVQGPSNAAFLFGTGDWTVECFVRSSTVNKVILDLRGGGSGLVFFVNSSSKYGVFTNSGGSIEVDGTSNALAGTWQHVAYVRDSNVLKVFVDGVLENSAAFAGNITSGQTPRIGAVGGDGSLSWNGWIDEMRVTKGVARYTTSFTPPDKPFPRS